MEIEQKHFLHSPSQSGLPPRISLRQQRSTLKTPGFTQFCISPEMRSAHLARARRSSDLVGNTPYLPRPVLSETWRVLDSCCLDYSSCKVNVFQLYFNWTFRKCQSSLVRPMWCGAFLPPTGNTACAFSGWLTDTRMSHVPWGRGVMGMTPRVHVHTTPKTNKRQN